jgi:polysaccharide biosynthesis transport protein
MIVYNPGAASPPPEGIQKIPVYCLPATEHSQSHNSAGGMTRHIRSIRRHARSIFAFVACSVIATYVVSSRLQPLYESTATIDVDRQAPSAVIGQDSYRNYGGSSVETDEFFATQAKLIDSDAVLRPVAQKYDLVHKESELEFKLPGQGLFSHIETPAEGEQAKNTPIGFKRLKITRPPNTYLLLIRYQSSDPKLASAVANSIAESYLEHIYQIRMHSSASVATFMETQSAELKAKMERSSQALARMEKELGVINPDEKTNIISARFAQLNADYTNAQSDRLKKEAICKLVKSGSPEALQVSGQAEQLVQLNQRLDEARQRLAEVEATYGSAHPEHRKIAAEVAELVKQINEARTNIAQRVEADYQQALGREQMFIKTLQATKAEADRVNARFFQYAQLKHEAEADKKLYEELIWKIKESVTNAGFQTNNIRIADIARPGLRPVFPKKGLNVLLALFFSSLLAVAAASVRDALDNTVCEPEQITRMLATDVIGILPVVKRAYGTKALNGYPEAIRRLRNTLELGCFGFSLRSIVITSANSGEGKTTTALNLAIAHAKHGKKTLLIDADLRDPKLHKVFGLSGHDGLSMILKRGPLIKPVQPIPVHRIKDHTDLYVIPAGPPPDQPSDLICSRLLDLVDGLQSGYDLIIIDAPPLLGFAESLELAMAADGVLLVARAGKTKMYDLSSGISELGRLRANVIGVVLNRMAGSLSCYSYNKDSTSNARRLTSLDSVLPSNGDSRANSLT